MRYLHAFVMLIALFVLTLMSAESAFAAEQVPTVNMTSEQEAVVQSAWNTFAATFPTKASCLSAPTVQGVAGYSNRLGGPGEYQVYTATVQVDPEFIVTDPTGIHTLYHEFGHHLDAVCGARAALTPQFQQVENMDQNRWYGDEVTPWSRTPAEAFAAIVSGLVEHRSTIDSVYTTNEAVVMVADWAGVPAPSWATDAPVVIMMHDTTTTTRPPATTTTSPPATQTAHPPVTTTTSPPATTTTRPPATTTTAAPTTTTTTRPPAPRLEDTPLPPKIMEKITADATVSSTSTVTTTTVNTDTLTPGVGVAAASDGMAAAVTPGHLDDPTFYRMVAGLLLTAAGIVLWLFWPATRHHIALIVRRRRARG